MIENNEIEAQAQIRLLAKMALKESDTDNDGLTVFDDDELEKFAELIVKECADFVVDAILDEVGKRYAESVATDLKKHFGVEE